MIDEYTASAQMFILPSYHAIFPDPDVSADASVTVQDFCFYLLILCHVECGVTWSES
jgi:hypothetical protein